MDMGSLLGSCSRIALSITIKHLEEDPLLEALVTTIFFLWNLIYHLMLRSHHLLQKLNFFQDLMVYVMNYYKRMGVGETQGRKIWSFGLLVCDLRTTSSSLLPQLGDMVSTEGAGSWKRCSDTAS